MIARLTRREDVPALQNVLDATELFPTDMLAELIEGFLSKDGCTDLWLTAEVGGKVVGFCYAVPEKLTDGTWNMLAIAVLPSEQGKGYGGAICRQLEAELRTRGQRILIVDTSSRDEFLRTRKFYHKNQYYEEARVRDFWSAGDDKVIFRKSLA
jgi:ribosomal protein S18 acetylase RimI-like enzyme